jgi:hypothetical protein
MGAAEVETASGGEQVVVGDDGLCHCIRWDRAAVADVGDEGLEGVVAGRSLAGLVRFVYSDVGEADTVLAPHHPVVHPLGPGCLDWLAVCWR